MAEAPEGKLLQLLVLADKYGVHVGGLFLIALGFYGGQYADKFPENLRHIAGVFALVVAAVGLICIVYHLIRAALK